MRSQISKQKLNHVVMDAVSVHLSFVTVTNDLDKIHVPSKLEASVTSPVTSPEGLPPAVKSTVTEAQPVTAEVKVIKGRKNARGKPVGVTKKDGVKPASQFQRLQGTVLCLLLYFVCALKSLYPLLLLISSCLQNL